MEQLTFRSPCLTSTHSRWRGDFSSRALAQSWAEAVPTASNAAMMGIIVRFMTLHLRCESKHDVEFRGQLAHARVLDRDKGHDDRSFCSGIADAVEDAVAFVLRFALGVTFCGPFPAALDLGGNVNVPRG